jgi:hypothetical protein
VEIALSADTCDAGRGAGADAPLELPEPPERAAPPSSDTAQPESSGTVARTVAIIAAFDTFARTRGLDFIDFSI